MSAALSGVTLKLIGVDHVFQIPVCHVKGLLIYPRRAMIVFPYFPWSYIQLTDQAQRIDYWQYLQQRHGADRERIQERRSPDQHTRPRDKESRIFATANYRGGCGFGYTLHATAVDLTNDYLVACCSIENKLNERVNYHRQQPKRKREKKEREEQRKEYRCPS